MDGTEQERLCCFCLPSGDSLPIYLMWVFKLLGFPWVWMIVLVFKPTTNIGDSNVILLANNPIFTFLYIIILEEYP